MLIMETESVAGMVHQDLGQPGPAAESAITSEMQVNLKRQRRPSVRLGEIGDEPMPLVLKKLFKRRKPRPTSDGATAAYVHKFRDGTDPAVGGADPHKPKKVRPMKQAANVSTSGDEMHCANSDEILAERFQEELHVDDDGTDGYFQPVRKVHVSLKKRTKRGKHGRRKRVLANRSSVTSSSAKIAKILEGNSKDITNLIAGEGEVGDGASRAICHDPRVVTHNEILEPLEEDAAEGKHLQFEQKINRDVDSHCNGCEKAGESIKGKGIEKMNMNEGDDSELKGADDFKHESTIHEEATNQMPNLEIVRDPEVSSNSHLNAILAPPIRVTRANEGISHLVDTGVPALSFEVASWLEALSLGKYADLFELHEVDKDVLPHLTIDDLKEMGIVAVGTRRKLFTAIQTLGHKS